MQFRTEINLDKSDLLFDHADRIVTIGSCFAEKIAEYFKYYRFTLLDNPFGVLYNPASVFNVINLLNENKVFDKDDLIFEQNEWHSFYHHSNFSHHEIDECLKNINTSLIEAKNFLSKTKILIITYGTSYVYKHIARDYIVSNCHKIPSGSFEHFRLTLDEVIRYIEASLHLLNLLNNNLKIIFTVSPVRHWKDGAVDNQLSKSTLLLAVNKIVSGNKNCVYFPSYEILMDDLRDYRFYKSDLIHPNKIATDYVWDKFKTAHLKSECEAMLKEIDPIAKARFHRSRNIHSEKNKIFLQSQLNRIEELEKKYNYLSLTDDKKHFQKLLEEISAKKN